MKTILSLIFSPNILWSMIISLNSPDIRSLVLASSKTKIYFYDADNLEALISHLSINTLIYSIVIPA